MKSSSNDLWNYWNELLVKYTNDQTVIENSFEDLKKHYSASTRYYHNLDHLKALVYWYTYFQNRILKQEVVLFSIFFHDIVYIPGKRDNEYLSAQVALQSLQKLNVPEHIRGDVSFFINATKDHKVEMSKDYDLKYFIDFDLSILATERSSYKTYLANIRKEYSFLTLEQFINGRIAFLQQMLQKQQIFNTKEFRSKEELARENIIWELQSGHHLFFES